MQLIPGSRLDSFEILVLLGKGGMGEVYRARDTSLKRDVAIKVLRGHLSQDSDRLRRFQVEAEATASLNHPNILSVFHIGEYDGSPYIVTELLDGETLRNRLRRGPIGTREAVELATQAARGLAAAHGAGIVHRDLKPENLFLTRDGRLKILDFGLAKFVREPTAADMDSSTVTGGSDTGGVMGTVGYMSPEQLRGRSADFRTDLFSFGAILYEMLSGKRAFHKSTAAETISAILNEEPPEISRIVPATPPALDRLVHRCLAKPVEQRFQSVSDLAFALEESSGRGGASSVAARPGLSERGWRGSPH